MKRIAPSLLIGAAVFTTATSLAVKLWPDSPAPVSGNKHETSAATTATAPAHVPPLQALLAAVSALPGDTASVKTIKEAAAQAARHPKDPAALVNLGDALAQRIRETADPGLYSLALTSYQQALVLTPNRPDALTGVSWVYGGQHRFDESVDWAQRALAVEPGNVAAHGLLGDAALEVGSYDAAYASYQKMLDLRPDLSALSRGAYLLWINGDSNRAAIIMAQAIRAGGPYAENTSWCRARLAMMNYHQGAYLPAARTLEVPLAASTTNTHVLLAAARIACALQDLQTGKDYFERVLKNGPHHDALVGLGDIASSLGQKTEADMWYGKVIELHAYNLTHGIHDHMAMAKFYADRNENLQHAIRLAEQHKDTKNVLEADVLAWVYHKADDQKRAMAAIKIALSRNTPDAEIYYHAGMIAAKAGNAAAARRYLQKALSLNPQFSLTQAPVASKMLRELSTGRAEEMPAQAENSSTAGS